MELIIILGMHLTFTEDMDISVPAAEDIAEEDRTVGEIIVNVTKYGGIILNGSEVSAQDLQDKLRIIAETYPGQSVILRGHVNTSFQDIIQVLDLVKKAGIINIAFASMKDRPSN